MVALPVQILQAILHWSQLFEREFKKLPGKQEVQVPLESSQVLQVKEQGKHFESAVRKRPSLQEVQWSFVILQVLQLMSHNEQFGKLRKYPSGHTS